VRSTQLAAESKRPVFGRGKGFPLDPWSGTLVPSDRAHRLKGRIKKLILLLYKISFPAKLARRGQEIFVEGSMAAGPGGGWRGQEAVSSLPKRVALAIHPAQGRRVSGEESSCGRLGKEKISRHHYLWAGEEQSSPVVSLRRLKSFCFLSFELRRSPSSSSPAKVRSVARPHFLRPALPS
jgi:hypothetical protein